MNEWIHDVHGFLWDSDVGVDLLEDFVDVDGEGLNSSSSGFSVAGRLGSFGLFRLFSHLYYLIMNDSKWGKFTTILSAII